MIEEFLSLLESSDSWGEITKHLNEKFDLSLTGHQRPKGKGYDGAVVKKWDNLRISSCEWLSADSDNDLMLKAFESYKYSNSAREERGFVPAVRLRGPTLEDYDESKNGKA